MSDEGAPASSAPAQQEAPAAAAAAPANPRLKLSLDDLVSTNKPKKAPAKKQKKPAPKKTKPMDRQARGDAAAPYQPRQVSSPVAVKFQRRYLADFQGKQRRERHGAPQHGHGAPGGLQIQFNSGGARGGYGGPPGSAAFDRREGRPLQARSAPYEQQVNPNQPHKLMILNLHDDVEAGDLQEIFGEVGKVLGSKVDRNADGSSKGTGEVLMATREQAEKAKTEFDAADVNGRIIGVRMLGAANGRGRLTVNKHQQARGGAPPQGAPFGGRGGGHAAPAHAYGGFQGGPQGGRGGGPVQFQVTLDSGAAAGMRQGNRQQGDRRRERQQPMQQRNRPQNAPAKHAKKQGAAPQAKAQKPKQPKAAPKPAPTQAEMDAEMAAYMAKTAQ